MLKQRLASFKYALQGVAELFRSQTNAKLHLFAAIVVCVVGYFVGLSTLEWCIVVLCISLVLAAEAFNTALEYLTDLVSPNHHPLAGKVKDVAAAAVLLTAIGAAVCGILIFLPKIIKLLGT